MNPDASDVQQQQQQQNRDCFLHYTIFALVRVLTVVVGMKGTWIICSKFHLTLLMDFTCYYCWEGLGARGERDDRAWDGWMASLTRWTWVWVNSGSWWWTGRPGVLQFMGSQRVGHDWATDLIWSDCLVKNWLLPSSNLKDSLNSWYITRSS